MDARTACPRGRRSAWIGRTIATACGAAIVAVALVSVAAMTGLLSPFQTWIATSKLERLERHLALGETRAHVESQFGRAVPRPDALAGYYGTARSANAAGPGWDDHLGQYSYASSTAFCTQSYLGVVVSYDRHDRVKSWKRFEWTDGC